LDVVHQIAKSEDGALACRFFLFFSRFEYALKRTGFVLNKPRSDGAIADWPRFAQENASLIDTNGSVQFKDAVAYIESHPPKRQVLSDGRLDMVGDNYSGPFDLKRLLLLVGRIRNNLFHGGKFSGGLENDFRDRQLLESAIAVLKVCLESHDRLKKNFLEDFGSG
jgi:hypothetical protein